MLFEKKGPIEKEFCKIRKNYENGIATMVGPLFGEVLSDIKRDGEGNETNIKIITECIYLYNEMMDFSESICHMYDDQTKLLIDSYELLQEVFKQNDELLERVKKLEKNKN